VGVDEVPALVGNGIPGDELGRLGRLGPLPNRLPKARLRRCITKELDKKTRTEITQKIGSSFLQLQRSPCVRESGRGMSCIGGGNEKGGENSCEEKIDRGIHRSEDRILLDSEDSATMNGPLGI